MMWQKQAALMLLGAVAAMIVATWWYGSTGGFLVAWIGYPGMLAVFIATVLAMLLVALWRPRKPVVSARAPGWEPALSAEEIELQHRREVAYEARQRRSAESEASAPFTKSTTF